MYKPKHVIHKLKCQWRKCGKKFTAGRKDAKYCSDRCNSLAWLEANPRERNKVEMVAP